MPESETTLSPVPASAAAARRFVATSLDEWGQQRITEVAVLLTDELVTNAILHAGSDVSVTVAMHDGGLRVDVSDASRHLPEWLDDEPHLGESGRGLHLVDALATAWGVRPHSGGKTVWFELA